MCVCFPLDLVLSMELHGGCSSFCFLTGDQIPSQARRSYVQRRISLSCTDIDNTSLGIAVLILQLKALFNNVFTLKI